MIDGVYYNFDTSTKEATVTSGSPYYTGSVTIPETVTYNNESYRVTSIENSAFAWCSDLTSVTIPNSVTTIGNSAFYYCLGLTEVTIPNSVTAIEASAFGGCSSLTEVTIPNSVREIEVCAFSYCSSLSSISVEDGNTVYDSRDHCNAIIHTATNTLIAGCMNTVIPNSVTEIGGYAFAGCTGLLSATIPNSVTEIGNCAFAGCTGLLSATIPNSVTEIGNCAFQSCSSLSEVIIPNSVTSISDYAFFSCLGLTSVTIPNSVTTIAPYAFSYCLGLTEVTIPNSVTTIGNYAFWCCTGLKDIYCYAENVPTVGVYIFMDTPISSATLHVPAASLEAYKTKNPWKGFGSIVAIGDPTGIKTLEGTQQDSDVLPYGKYMMNGKIIIMKKGKKYDAAGRCCE